MESQDDLLISNVTVDIRNTTTATTVIPIGGPYYIEHYPHVAYPYLVIAGCSCVIGTVGNIMVLVTLAISKSLRNARNVFLINLGIADLLVATYADPLSLLGMAKGKAYFDARPALCDITATICLTTCVSALFSIGCISFNRYLNICHPAIYPKVFNLRNNIVMCGGCWLIGTVMSLPGLLGWTENVYDHKMLECIWNRLHSVSYTIFFSAGVILAPVLIICFSYICIFLHVHASQKRIATEMKGSKSMAGSIKLARTLFIIFLIFVGCWFPYALLVVIDFEDRFPHEVPLYILLLAHMHSTLNPIVYGITNVHFKNGYRYILAVMLSFISKQNVGIIYNDKDTEKTVHNIDEKTDVSANPVH